MGEAAQRDAPPEFFPAVMLHQAGEQGFEGDPFQGGAGLVGHRQGSG